jgi:hypothetical protein
MVRVDDAIRNVAVRAGPGFAGTLNVIAPVPLPEPGDHVNHIGPAAPVVQVHVDVAPIVMAAVPPPAGIDTTVGETAGGQNPPATAGATAWITASWAASGEAPADRLLSWLRVANTGDGAVTCPPF